MTQPGQRSATPLLLEALKAGGQPYQKRFLVEALGRIGGPAKEVVPVLKEQLTDNDPSYLVEVCNVLGAGDAFASGFLYGYLKGWDWYRSARMGNACGAIVVTRHGCANFMPYEKEALTFVEAQGGF